MLMIFKHKDYHIMFQNILYIVYKPCSFVSGKTFSLLESSKVIRINLLLMYCIANCSFGDATVVSPKKKTVGDAISYVTRKK